jgi:hypothetical protein
MEDTRGKLRVEFEEHLERPRSNPHYPLDKRAQALISICDRCQDREDLRTRAVHLEDLVGALNQPSTSQKLKAENQHRLIQLVRETEEQLAQYLGVGR